MPCLLALAIVAFPRVVLILMWLFTNILGHAYRGFVIPLLGFIFLPVTTIVYAWMATSGMPLVGFNVFLLVVAVLIDAGGHKSGVGYYRRT